MIMKHAVVVFLAATACMSQAQYAEQRRADLLATYPLGITENEVVKRIGREPDFMEPMRASGWRSGWISARVQTSEQRTGKRVWKMDAYDLTGCGSSSPLSLCRAYFFLDEHDQVVDVEWQYRSD